MFAQIHNAVLKLGQGIYDFFAGIDFGNVSKALSITGFGWLGIFIVTIVIILVVTLLNKVFSK